MQNPGASLGVKENILDAAYRLFGEVGFDAASTREIALLSGVNKALIHYHFKSKDALLEAVLDHYYNQLNGVLISALSGKGTLRQRLERMIDAYVDFLAGNINFSRIVQRESAGGKHIGRVREQLSPLFGKAVELIQAAYPGTKSGELAAHQLLVSFYGMIIAYFTYSGVLSHLVGKDPLARTELKARKQHLMRMLDIVLKELDGS